MMSKSDSTETLPTLETLVIELCRIAAGRFGSADGTTFNTAAFQSIVGDLCGQKPTGNFVSELLAKNPRVVRLAGGCHWFVLPNNMERYMIRDNLLNKNSYIRTNPGFDYYEYFINKYSSNS